MQITLNINEQHSTAVLQAIVHALNNTTTLSAEPSQAAMPSAAIVPSQPVSAPTVGFPTAQPGLAFPPQAPAPAAPTSMAPPANVPPAQPILPTTAPTYSMDQLAVAGTQLVDAGRGGELRGLLNSFGVEALTQLPVDHYGAFATQLRALGARI